MAKFTIVGLIRTGKTEELGRRVAETLNQGGTCTVELRLDGDRYELRAWDGFRDDGSNLQDADVSTDY